MYQQGEDKIETELDIVKMMKTLRDIKILVKNTWLSDAGTKYAVKHAPRNIINVDESSDIDELSDIEIQVDNDYFAKD